LITLRLIKNQSSSKLMLFPNLAYKEAFSFPIFFYYSLHDDSKVFNSFLMVSYYSSTFSLTKSTFNEKKHSPYFVL